MATATATKVDYERAFKDLRDCVVRMRDQYQGKADEKWAAYMEYRQSADLNDHFTYTEARSALNVVLGLADEFTRETSDLEGQI